MIDGDISPDQADTIADAAEVNPSAEDDLLDAAKRENLNALRDRARRAKAAADPDPDATHARIHRERRLTRHTDGEGAWNLYARGTAEAGAVINSALAPIIDEIFNTNRTNGIREQRDTYAFDALVELARRATNGDATDTANPTSKGKKKGTGTNPRFLSLVRVDLEALQRGKVDGDELCEITGIGPIPVRVARDLLGESILKLVITKGVDVLNVTSLGRGPTAAMKIALAWSSPTCTVEGCTRTHVESDHRIDWATTRHTRLDELDHLCDGHHDLKTHHGWALVHGKGKRPLVPPDDPRHPNNTMSREPTPPPGPPGPPGTPDPADDQPTIDQPHLFTHPAA